MSVSTARAEFERARREVVELLRLARTLPDSPTAEQRISPQEVLLRSIVVLIVGGLHGFLLALLTEWADSLDPNWNNLSAIQRKYVAIQVYRRLADLLKDVVESNLGDDTKQGFFLDSVRKSAEWLNNPSALATARDRHDLREFFRDHGGKAIDRALASFSDDPMLFFDWLSRKDPRYADYRERLNSAIEVRNEAAHGVVNRRITLRDVKVYRVTIIKIVQHADEFVRRAQVGAIVPVTALPAIPAAEQTSQPVAEPELGEAMKEVPTATGERQAEEQPRPQPQVPAEQTPETLVQALAPQSEHAPEVATRDPGENEETPEPPSKDVI